MMLLPELHIYKYIYVPRIYFPGGYFDGTGGVHFLHSDYQGSVVMVTDSAGRVEQHNTYYPYGEPHRLPSGQPILYGGKERDAISGEYNYDARRLYSPGLLMTTPDPAASSTPGISPYVFCGANPIRNTDITGCEFTPGSLRFIESGISIPISRHPTLSTSIGLPCCNPNNMTLV